MEQPGGELNDNAIVTRSGSRHWLRMRKPGARDTVREYLRELYGAMGIARWGGKVVFRSIAEEVDLLRRCAAAGVAVPAVVDAGDDWLLTEVVDGTTLDRHLAAEGGPAAIPEFLDAVDRAHRAGFVMWDRWGGNEIVRPDGSVVLVDFDVDVRPAPPAAATVALAVAVRACLLWAGDRPVAVDATSRWLGAGADAYDVEELRTALAGSCEFYLRRPQRAALSSSPSAAAQQATNAAVDELLARLSA